MKQKSVIQLTFFYLDKGMTLFPKDPQ